MEVSMQLYVLLLSGAVLLSLILLTGLCLRCRRHNLPTSIQQRYSEDYTQHTPGFGLAHPPYNPSSSTSWGAPPSSLLSPISPQIVLRPNSVTPTENGEMSRSSSTSNVYFLHLFSFFRHYLYNVTVQFLLNG
ncbi:linker for activation of T-cells family member 1 [Oncorhynchus mykiss]|uniref:linker for activation of T-cells family member 1 n=1 Tax=Oncorhynchus mykiss TaxID=8022 RepID=UPI0018784540|nr:linker for activation of T-cells family member 1 [Oncorhynchus mykiss]